MKRILFSFLIASLWHLIFLFGISIKFFSAGFYENKPQVIFLGQMFQSSRRIQFQTSGEELSFLNSLFKPQSSFFKKPVLQLTALPSRVDFNPFKFKKVDLDLKNNFKDYVLLSSLKKSGGVFRIELNQTSTLLLVENVTLVGNMLQDFRNWFEVKSLDFYSALGKDILFKP